MEQGSRKHDQLAPNVHVNGSDELDITALLQGGTWTSGRIKSAAAFAPPQAVSWRSPRPSGSPIRPTASATGPPSGCGQGTWPAHGEIDILEDVNAIDAHSGALHCGNLSQHNADGTLGPCREYIGFTSHLLPCSECQDGFHTYSVIIDRRNPYDQQIRWYLDGGTFGAAEPEVGAATWAEAIDHGFSIILTSPWAGLTRMRPATARHPIAPPRPAGPCASGMWPLPGWVVANSCTLSEANGPLIPPLCPLRPLSSFSQAFWRLWPLSALLPPAEQSRPFADESSWIGIGPP